MITSNNPEVVKGVLLVCQGALLNIRPIAMLTKVFSGIANLLCTLADKSIQDLTSALMVIPAIAPENLTVENPTIAALLTKLDVL